MTTDVIPALQAIAATAGWTAGLFLHSLLARHGRSTLFVLRDGVWLLSLSWLILALFNPAAETRPYVYAIRLVAFGLIILATIDKNRTRDRRPRE